MTWHMTRPRNMTWQMTWRMTWHMTWLKISTFPIVVTFSVTVCLRWLYHHILTVLYVSREKPGCVSFITMQPYAVWKLYNGLIRLFVHHITSLTSLCRRLCIYWITEILVRNILSRVCLSQLPQLSEVWPIFHCLVFDHETSVYALCLSIYSYDTWQDTTYGMTYHIIARHRNV